MSTLLKIAQAYDVSGGGDLKARCKAAMSYYAMYIINGGSADANRIAWAKSALQGMDAQLERIRWPLAGDAQFAADLASISDANLQPAVENAVNALVPLVS